MIEDKRFIIIAGTARNVGKTTLACKLIQNLSQANIIALKFITLKTDAVEHSHHKDIERFSIFKEDGSETLKDTVRMLNSGANESYLLVSKEAFIQKAIEAFMKKLSPKDIVIVESATLRNYLVPKLFVVVDREGLTEKKPYIKQLMPLANHSVTDVFDSKQTASILSDLK